MTKGNLVGPGSPLTLVVSQREFLRICQEGGHANRESVLVKLRFADGSEYGPTGKIDFVDVSVDRSTGTVLVHARVPNPDSALIADQFVRVSVVGETPEEKVVIPQAALLADQEGTYVLVAQDGKAVIKRIKTGGAVGTGIAIDSGLAPGDVVIVNGTQTLRPGAAVVATPIPEAPNTTG